MPIRYVEKNCAGDSQIVTAQLLRGVGLEQRQALVMALMRNTLMLIVAPSVKSQHQEDSGM
ncbi:hypothetical protein [Escherichia coli]|uniref:hypothetical protein n=1 Tax=Escherichia coli TaxID=562 RepID=UPI0018917918|nr:hypothetical protein [Escherichia coli]